MGLTSLGVLILVVLLAVAAPVVTAFGWNRLGRRRWIRRTARAGLLITSQLTAVVLVGIVLNNSYGFYGSWSELLGTRAPQLTASAATPAAFDQALTVRTAAAFRAGRGTILNWRIPGTTSGLPTQPALAYLPAAYGNPAAATTRFPVVELLQGFPGHPASWTQHLNLQRTLDTQIRKGYTVPFIAVVPTQNVAAPRDTQCVNVVGGPRVEDYLVTDVKRATVKAFRAATDKTGWTVMGYSTGGFCAVNLAMRHPETFSAAVSLGGYTRPAHDGSTGELFGGSASLRDQNTPVWRAENLPKPPVSLLLMTTRDDVESFRDTQRLLAVGRPPLSPLSVSSIVLDRGGHNYGVWAAMEPTAFDWLSRHVAPPLAPIQALDLRIPKP